MSFRFGVFSHGNQDETPNPDEPDLGACKIGERPAMTDVALEPVDFDRVRGHFTVPDYKDAHGISSVRTFYRLAADTMPKAPRGSVRLKMGLKLAGLFCYVDSMARARARRMDGPQRMEFEDERGAHEVTDSDGAEAADDAEEPENWNLMDYSLQELSSLTADELQELVGTCRVAQVAKLRDLAGDLLSAIESAIRDLVGNSLSPTKATKSSSKEPRIRALPAPPQGSLPQVESSTSKPRSAQPVGEPPEGLQTEILKHWNGADWLAMSAIEDMLADAGVEASQSQIRGALNEMAEQGTISVTGEKRAKRYKAV